MTEEIRDSKTTINVKKQDDESISSGLPSNLGPEAEDWTPKVRDIPSSPIRRVKAVGDLHGWAPGLVSYLTLNQLAKIEINGLKMYEEGVDTGELSLHEENVNTVFPNQASSYRKEKKFHFFNFLSDK